MGERHEFVMLGRHDEAFALNDSATFWYYDGLGLASRAVSATLSRTKNVAATIRTMRVAESFWCYLNIIMGREPSTVNDSYSASCCNGIAGSSVTGCLRRRSRSIKAHGVTTRVRIDAKSNPTMIVTASICHHKVAGARKMISRDRKSIDTPKAMGKRPKAVVIVVRNTGRSRCAPV